MSKDTTLANQIINESIRGYVENSISTSASAISRDNQENTTLPPSYKRSDLSIDTTSLGNEYTKYITTYYETEKYSITPGTFDSRDFVVPSTRPDLDYYIAAVGAQVQNQNIKGQDLATELNSNISSIEKLSESIIDIALDATSQQDIDLDESFIATSESAQKWLTDLQRYKAFTDALPINTQNTDAADTTKLNLLSFKDQYSNGSSIVTRFGISLATLSDHEIQDLLSTQQNLDTNLQERSVAQSPDTATQQNSRNTNDGINKILYPLEVLRIKDAIDFLTNYVSNDTSNDTTDDLSKDRNNYTGPNASLVDIFARI